MQKVIIKKYANNKLYIPRGNTEKPGYISLPNVIDIIRSGKSVVVVDNVTGEDITDRMLKSALEYVTMGTEQLERIIRGV